MPVLDRPIQNKVEKSIYNSASVEPTDSSSSLSQQFNYATIPTYRSSSSITVATRPLNAACSFNSSNAVTYLLTTTCSYSPTVTVMAKPLNAAYSYPTSVTVMAKPLNAACCSSPSVNVVANPLNEACSYSTSTTVLDNPLNEACSSFTYVPPDVAEPISYPLSDDYVADAYVPPSVVEPIPSLKSCNILLSSSFAPSSSTSTRGGVFSPLPALLPETPNSSSVNPSHQVASTAAWWEGCEGMSSGTTSPSPSPTSVATGIFQLSLQTTTRIVADVLSPFSWTSSVKLTISNSASSPFVNLTYNQSYSGRCAYYYSIALSSAAKTGTNLQT